MITLDDYQQEARDWLSVRKRGVVVAPAGSGKTIIASASLYKCIHGRPRTFPAKVGWIANTQEQRQQAYKAMLQVFHGIEVETAQAPDTWGGLVHGFDFKSACAASETDWSDRDVLVVDEAHHSVAESWHRQIETCNGARWAFTATPPEDDDKLKAMLALFGNEILTIDRSRVKNRLAAATVRMLDATDTVGPLIDREIDRVMKYRERWWRRAEVAKHRQVLFSKTASEAEKERATHALERIRGELWAQISWQCCIDIGIVKNVARNRAVVETARKHASDSVLVLVNQIEHGQYIAESIPGAQVCFSKLGAKKRREMLAAFGSGDLRCMVATSLADEGFDCPRANVLILVSGGRSRAKSEQRTGRVLRQFAGKTHGLCYDFYDMQHPLMAKHSRARVDLYRSLGYRIT